MGTKISALPVAGSITDGDKIPIVNGGVTKTATPAQIRGLVAAGELALSKLAPGTAAQIPIVNAGGTAFVAVTITGDVLVTSTGVTSIATGVIVDADVNASAAIAGSKISPAFGAQNVTFTGFLGIGATIPTAGDIRVANVFQIRAMNSTNAAERQLFKWNADTLTLGDAAGGIANIDLEANQLTAYFINDAYIDATNVYMRGAAHGTSILQANTTAFAVGVPLVGNGSAWGSVNGFFTKAMSGSTYTLTNTEYTNTIIQVTGTGGNTIKLPAATNAQAYIKFVWNAGTSTLTVQDSNSVGAAASLAASTGAFFLCANGIVKQLTAAFTVA